MNRDKTAVSERAPKEKFRVATTSLAGCFGCHTSFVDVDERLLDLLQLIEFDRTPLTDVKRLGKCDVGIVEGGVCNAENVEVLREFRRRCTVLVAIGACAVNGGLPAQRNHLSLPLILEEVYHTSVGLANGLIPNDPELPLPFNKVRPLHELVHVDQFIPGCPPSADAIWQALQDILAGHELRFGHGLIHYD